MIIYMYFRHPIIKKLQKLTTSDPTLAELLSNQVLYIRILLVLQLHVILYVISSYSPMQWSVPD